MLDPFCYPLLDLKLQDLFKLLFTKVTKWQSDNESVCTFQ